MNFVNEGINYGCLVIVSSYSIHKFGVYFEGDNLVGRGWEMQEGLAVEPLLLGCGLKAHDLKRLEYQLKQINSGCLE